MKILLTLVIMAVLLVSMAACGDSDDPSGPVAGNDHEFYPMAVGNVWQYDRSGTISMGGSQTGSLSGEATIEISGTETHSGGFQVFVQDVHVKDTTTMMGQTFYVDSSFTEYLRLTDGGLFGYRHLTDTDSSFTVPFPIQLGATWTFAEEPPTTGEILSLSASVTVPAGSFSDCMEMQLTWIDSGMTVMNTADFARNVGEVRNVFHNTFGTFETIITNSLESYTLY